MPRVFRLKKDLNWRQAAPFAVVLLAIGGIVVLCSPASSPNAPASAPISAAGGTADEIHYSVVSPTSVGFDWRGSPTDIRYGTTTAYGSTATAGSPPIMPFSSAGPFMEVVLSNLQPGTTYHYSIGSGADHTFRTAPAAGSANYSIAVEGDVGGSNDFSQVPVMQNQIAGAHPDLGFVVGDITYANPNGQAEVDAFYNDVMPWAANGTALMPIWGNHEWDGTGDNLTNYKGRSYLPNAQTDPASPSVSCCGRDWYWFDYGNTRFIAYPEPWSGDNWSHWNSLVGGIMDQAQANPSIRYIVTFGHRPAWSTGYHPGESTLKGYLKNLHTSHSKYVLNLNGHSHNYERTDPTLTDGVVNLTVGTGGGYLENVSSGSCLWQSCPAPAWSVKRYMHYGVATLNFGADSISGQFLCGGKDSYGSTDVTCSVGAVLDTFTIAAGGPPPSPTPTPTATPTPTPTPTPTATPTPTPPAVTGDLNGDGKVNIFDLSTLLSRWGTSNAAADLNHNGLVDVFDLSILLSHWTG